VVVGVETLNLIAVLPQVAAVRVVTENLLLKL
jgi:hypothetical protein